MSQKIKILTIAAGDTAEFDLTVGHGMSATSRMIAISATDRCNVTVDFPWLSTTEEINGPTVFWKPKGDSPILTEGQLDQWTGGSLSFYNTESTTVKVTITQIDF
jgi:hypothetical protein